MSFSLHPDLLVPFGAAHGIVLDSRDRRARYSPYELVLDRNDEARLAHHADLGLHAEDPIQREAADLLVLGADALDLHVLEDQGLPLPADVRVEVEQSGQIESVDLVLGRVCGLTDLR